MSIKNICIIGAGISGLAAANQLQKNGVTVTVLEARSYIGGRVKFDHSLGLPFPCGAAFIHDTRDDILFRLIRKHNPKLINFQDLPYTIFDSNQKIFSTEKIKESHMQFEHILTESKENMRTITKDKSLLESINDIINDNKKIYTNGLKWEQTYLSLFTGVETKYLSAKNWNQMEEFSGDYLLLTSYDSLVESLSRNINITLNTIVRSVKCNDTHVIIETQNGSIKTEAVIITVPLGVLKSNDIQFFPELPPEKLRSIHKLKMSVLNKIGMLFPKQFWPNDSFLIGYDSNPNHHLPLFFNYGYFFPKPMLLGAVSGDAAIEIEQLGEKVFIEHAMNTLKKLFGSKIPYPLATITTTWMNDPFSQGSYSYVPIGADGSDFDTLAEPVANKIFFAGEATFRSCHSTVQGGYLSGIREANRILNEN